jgi:hypothetical protein
MKDHEAHDNRRFDEITERLKKLATKEDLKGLATEASVRDVVHWSKNVVAAANVLEGTGKWSFRAILALAALFGALGVIVGGWKAVIGFIFSKV